MTDFTQIDEIAIKKYQNGEGSITKIAKELGVDRGCLARRLKEKGVNVVADNGRKYTLNHDFFEIIDTEEKAYWLGFVFADGYMSKPDGSRYILEIGLSLVDENHIKKFLNSIESNYHMWRKKNAGNGAAVVHICSKKMYQDLESHGCCNKKSLKPLKPTGIPKELINHFIRGYFDGNGSLHKTGNYVSSARIYSGNKEILEFIYDNMIESAREYYSIYYDRTCYCLGTSKTTYARQFIYSMYDNANIYLDRKYETYKNCILPFRDKDAKKISKLSERN